MRNVPLLLSHYELTSQVPMHMATGFAAFLLYMKVSRKEGSRYFGERNAAEYEIKDDSAEYFYNLWSQYNPAAVIATVLSNESLWETNLSNLPGFQQAVKEQLQEMMKHGVLQVVEQLESKKVTA